MAKTFNYGAGIWATKTGSSMAYNDQNNNYKPTPFSVTRDSIATRVNKQGLIEVVGKDKLRIDYTDSTKGVALLEPAATNVITNSNIFNANANVSVDINNTISPDGSINAVKVTGNSGTSLKLVDANGAASGTYIISVFAKKDTHNFIQLGTGALGTYANFDLNNGVSSSNGSIQDYGNGWYRCSFQQITGAPSSHYISLIDNMSATRLVNSSTTNSVFLYGFQSENSSHITSYTPTSGSTVTRAADVANGAGNSEVFNDSEGVLYANIAALANDLTYRVFGLSDGSTSNRIILYYNPSSNNIELFISSGGASQATLSLTLSDIKLYQKVAVKYKSNDIGLWINGFEVGTDTSATMPSGLNELAFDNSTGTQNFYGKTKRISVYDAVLTDAELEALTSYTSFTNMANELNLTIK